MLKRLPPGLELMYKWYFDISPPNFPVQSARSCVFLVMKSTSLSDLLANSLTVLPFITIDNGGVWKIVTPSLLNIA